MDGGRLRPAHLLLALIERRELMVSSAITKLGHDPEEVLRGLDARLVGERRKTPRRKTQDKIEKEEKETALRRFGRDLTELAAAGALPPLIGRREEMLKITQILLQSRKSNLILVGEPGVGKTGIVEGFAQLTADGKLEHHGVALEEEALPRQWSSRSRICRISGCRTRHWIWWIRLVRW